MDKARVYNVVDVATEDEDVAVYGLSRVNSVGFNRTDCPVDLIPTISVYLSGKNKSEFDGIFENDFFGVSISVPNKENKGVLCM